MYEVVEYFEDLQDGGHPYNVGDAYPRKGLEVNEARINALLTGKNARNTVFISEKAEKASKAEEPTKSAPKKVTKNGQNSSTKSSKGRLGKKE